MSRRHTCLGRLLAAVMVLGATSALLAQEPAEPPTKDEPVAPSGQEHGGNGAEDKGQSEPHDPFGISAALDRIETAIRESVPREDQAQRERQNQREIDDLRAQQDMAMWAMWMFAATAASVALTFAALVAIIRTLHHTKRAADHSETMAAQAEQATKAANDTFAEARRANEIAQEALVAQHRPWITLEPTEAGPLELHGDEATVTVDLVAKNVSPFPARMVVIDARAFWTQSSTSWPTIKEVEAVVAGVTGSPYVQQNSTTMLPGGDFPHGFVQLRASRFPQPKAGARPAALDKRREIYVLIACCVAYKSTISEKWHHTAHLLYVRRKTPDGMDPRDRPPILLDTGRIEREDLVVSVAKLSAANSVT